MKNRGLLPYQEKWLQSPSRIKIWEKSRQIGATWTQALEDVMDCRAGRARKVFFSSADQEAGRAYIEYCGDWAEKIRLAIREMTQEKVEDDERTSYSLHFQNGAGIYALSSNPRRLRGKSGKIILDEFAHHDDARALWKAARPAAAWGHPIRIISTHHGKSSLFYSFLQSVQKCELDWYAQKTDVHDAVRQGLVDRICKRKTSEKERKDWIEKERRDCANPDIWAEEYCCNPSDESHAFLPYELISTCESDIPSSHTPPLEKGDTGGFEKAKNDLYVGVDVGRKKDLTVIWAVEKVGNVRFTRLAKPLENTRFAVQRDALWHVLQHKNVRRCCIDATGLGMQLAEETQEEFGRYRVEAVTFTARVKEELAYPVRAAMEDRHLWIPPNAEIREDFHSLRTTTTASGNVRLEVDRTERSSSHADYFWACALAFHASKEGFAELTVRTRSARRTQNLTRGYLSVSHEQF